MCGLMKLADPSFLPSSKENNNQFLPQLPTLPLSLLARSNSPDIEIPHTSPLMNPRVFSSRHVVPFYSVPVSRSGGDGTVIEESTEGGLTRGVGRRG